MLKTLKVKFSQGSQYVKDVRNAKLEGYRGKPVIGETECKTGCRVCLDACPTQAISLNPVTIDLGRCVFCNECTRICPSQKISFTPNYLTASSSREGLFVTDNPQETSAVNVSHTIQQMFGRSLKLRSVSAGGCNGCELELNALSNVNFDIGRFGIDFVASPRHADGLVISGPITANMSSPLRDTYAAMPDPKFVIAVGACAISGGVFSQSGSLNRNFLDNVTPDLYLPGCPPHPLTFLNGILELLGRF